MMVIYILRTFLIKQLKEKSLRRFNKFHKKYVIPFNSKLYDALDMEGKKAYYLLMKSMLTLISEKDYGVDGKLLEKVVDVNGIIQYIEVDLKENLNSDDDEY